MKSIQPNFEIVKTAFYQAFVASSETNMCILNETIVAGKLLGTFNSRLTTFKADFNKWLNGLDIRCVNEIAHACVKAGQTIPAWIKNRKFVIDYNERGALDLIRIN